MAGLVGETVRIGAYDYEFTRLPVEKGHPLRWELIALIGEPLILIAAKVIESGDLGDINVEQTLRHISGLLSRLDPRFVYRLQHTFVQATRYRGDGGEFVPLEKTWQTHFAGRYHELDALTWAHLRVNYLGFLDDSDVWQRMYHAGLQVLSAVKSQLTSPSTGKSGESSVAPSSA